MNKKLYTVAALSLVAFIAVGVLAINWRKSPQCNIHSLILDEERMPEGWKNQWAILPPALETLGAQHAYSIFMQNGNATAHHTVYQYSSRWRAVFHIWFEKEIFFPSAGWDWSELTEAGNLSLHADHRQIRCGNGNHLYLDNRCTAVFRYGFYISDFSSSVQEGVMSIDDFKEAVLKIDELFSSCAE